MRSTTPLVLAIVASTCADAIAIPRPSASSTTSDKPNSIDLQSRAIDHVAVRVPLAELNLSVKREDDQDEDGDNDGDESDGEDDDGDGQVDEDDEDGDDDGDDGDDKENKGKPNAGAIAGGVIGGLVGFGILLVLIFFLLIRPRRLKKPKKVKDRSLPKKEHGDQHDQEHHVHMAGAGGFASSPPDYNQTHSDATSSPMSLPVEKIYTGTGTGNGPAVPAVAVMGHPPNYDYHDSPSSHPSAPSPVDLSQQQQQEEHNQRPTAPTAAEILSSILPSGRRRPQEDENHIDPNPEIPLGPQTLTEHPADQPNPTY